MAAVGALLVAPVVRGQDRCADAAVPAVAVTFVGDAWTDAFRSRVLGELQGALAAQDMVACEEAQVAGRETVAHVELRTLGLPRVAVVIEVSDRVTQKRLARDLDLASFPEDGRALALAVASDELLRASWMELAMADAPEPALPPPPQVTRTVTREIERASPSSTEIGVRFATEAYSGGEAHLGGDVFFAHGLGEHGRITLFAGARRGLARDGQHGSVTASAIGGGLAIGWLPIDGDVRPGLELGVRAAQVFFAAEADPGGTARNDGGVVVVPTLAATLVLEPLDGLVIDLALGGGIAARGVAAIDAGARVTGATGAVLVGHAGIGWAL